MKKYILLLTVCFSLLSCDSFLDIQPKGVKTPVSCEDYNNLLGYVSISKGSASVFCYLTDDVRFGDENVTASFVLKEESAKRLYCFEHGNVFNPSSKDLFWDTSYNRIYIYNTVVNNVLKSTDGTKIEKNTLLGEALAGRAFDFLNLVSIYAPVYNKETAKADYGVPIVLSEDVNDMNYSRNSVQEVFDQIKKDLEAAIELLPEKSKNTFRANKASAYGILSRMYLRMQDYDNALKYANLSTQTQNDFTNLGLYSNVPEKAGTYIGLSIGVVLTSDLKTPYPMGDLSKENIYTRYCIDVYGNHLKIYANNDLKSAFNDFLPSGATDLRKQLFYRDDKWGNYNFPGFTMWGPRYYQNVGITTMEMGLTAAECYARKGDKASLDAAAIIYNKLRDSRIKGNVSVQFDNKEDALLRILNERRKEFAFLGEFRLVDLKRLNKEPKFAKEVIHEADGKVWKLSPNDPRYVFPLPPIVKGFRPDLLDYER